MKLILAVALLFTLLGVSHSQYTKAANCSVSDFEASFARAYGHFGSDRIKLPDTQSKLNHYCKYVNVANKRKFTI